MKKLMMILALLAAGCSTVTNSTPRGVTVVAGAGHGLIAQKKADAECAKHGKHARFSGKMSEVEFVFDCID